MKNHIPSHFRAVALVTLALLAHRSLGQADYSTPYTISKYAGLTGIAGTNDGTINYAQLNLPIGEAFDGSGNLYVADSGNQTIRKISPTGISTTFAGSAGNLGISDGTGTNARFKTPSGIAVDGAGNIYVSDSGNHTIRKISSAGVVTTLAGSAGNFGTSDGAGSSARFNNPIGLALTAAGELLVVDSNNHALRKVTSAGVVTTLAGTAGTSGSADGTGSAATFLNPHSAAIDVSGNIWVSDSGNHTIRKVTAVGVVTTFAGAAGSSGSTDGSGTAARFNVPQGLAFDSSGNLFVADWGNNLLRKISAAGAVTTFAGSTGSSRSTDGTAAGAHFQAPAGLVFDSSGTLYVSDFYNHTIRKATAAAVVTTWIGSPPVAGSTDGIGTAGLFNNPYFGSIAVDTSHNLYLADTFSHTIRKISAAGVVSTLAGLADTVGSADGVGSAARFNYPYGIAVDAAGNVYVADKNNNTIRKITAAGVVTTLAGLAGASGFADGTGSAARFSNPYGVAVDASGNLYVADYGTSTIRKITAAGVVTTVAGQAYSFASTDGTGSAARFFGPASVAVDGSGNIFVADPGNYAIRKITAAGVVTTLAGQANSPGSRDGVGTSALFNAPAALAVDATGNVFVADFSNNNIRLVTAAGVVKTVAGTAPIRGSNDGVGAAAQFADPTGVAVDSLGELYIVDSSNNLIRKGLPPGAASFSAQPVSQAAALGQSVTFTVAASGAGLTYQWQKAGANISGATGASYTIASPQSADAGSYTVLVTSGSITAASTPATLSVGSTVPSNPVSITTQPASQSVTAGQSVTFTVAASGSSLTYQWQKNSTPISGATNASYTIASAQAADAASYTVVITSGSNSATSSTAMLTVSTSVDPGRIKNLSSLVPLAAGEQFTFGFVVGGVGSSGAKPLLIRAGGPALTLFGYTADQVLSNPKLDFYSGQTLVSSNNKWSSSDPAMLAAQAATGAFAFPTNSLDAAINLPAAPTDNLSTIVTGPAGAAGWAIAEVYDATPAASFTATTPRLINVSVQKAVGTGFTMGFVLTGSTSTQVLIRAVGPTLGTVFNVPGVVPDPKITLYHGVNGVSVSIASNDDWGTPVGPGAATASDIAAATAKVTWALATGSKDAAILATLAPGDYTVTVSATGADGIAQVEVYAIP